MNDREEMGHFLRNRHTFDVFVDYSPFSGKIDSVIISHEGGEIIIKPAEYDETNKLHVNAFIVVTDAVFNAKEVVIDPLPEDWPKDYRLFPSTHAAAVH